VRQSDHGANVSSETAITLMTMVAITTHKRPRSSIWSRASVKIMLPTWRLALHTVNAKGFQ